MIMTPSRGKLPVLWLVMLYAAGRIKIGQISRVMLYMWSHSSEWKSGCSWAYVELRPILDDAQQQHEKERKQQWQQWRKAHGV
jgi:hypothetical protein